MFESVIYEVGRMNLMCKKIEQNLKLQTRSNYFQECYVVTYVYASACPRNMLWVVIF